jgi:hypothetical protein
MRHYPHSNSLGLQPIIAFIPFHKLPNARGNGGLWFKAHIPDQVIHIGIGGGHVTGLKVHKIFQGFFSKGGFNSTDKIEELNRLVITDIVNLIFRIGGAGVRRVAAPGRVGVGKFFMTRTTPSTMSSI